MTRLLKGATETHDGAVVALSGGIDSATLFAHAIQRFGKDNVFAVGFHYGQRHKIELEQAAKIAQHYRVSFEIIELPKIFAGAGSTLVDNDMLPQIMGSYNDLADKHGGQPTIVPGRNLNFLAMAATYAEVHKVNRVMIANHAGDSGDWHYFDCTPEFIAGASVAISVGTGFAVQLEAPFTLLSKAQVVSMAADLGVPAWWTQSCYNGVRPQCGKCATCHERLNAFHTAGFTDPAPYAEGIVQEDGYENWPGFNAHFQMPLF